jgi:hypothetical protein
MDKKGKDTGRGEFQEFLLPDQTGIVFGVDLYNYNIDGNLLKPRHRDYLASKLVPLLRHSRHHVKIRGFASKSGDFDYNLTLSKERVLRVKQFLQSHGIPESKVPGGDSDNLLAFGESRARGPDDEEAYDRRVRILVATGVKAGRSPRGEVYIGPVTDISPPPPPPSRPRPKQRGKGWVLRQIAGVNVGVGWGKGVVGASVGNTQYHFLLVEQSTGRQAECTFAGPAVSAGASVPIPYFSGSVTKQSRTWNRFETNDDASFADMEGAAVWKEPASLGLGTSYSLPARLELKRLGITVKVETGDTFGLPASSLSSGYFTCREPRQLRR